MNAIASTFLLINRCIFLVANSYKPIIKMKKSTISPNDLYVSKDKGNKKISTLTTESKLIFLKLSVICNINLKKSIHKKNSARISYLFYT